MIWDLSHAGAALEATLTASIWQGLLIALLAAPTLAALERGSAGTRHAVALVFLLAMPLWAGVTLACNLLAPPGALSASGLTLSGVRLPVELRWLWLGGVAFNAIRLAGGWLGLRDLERSFAQPLPVEWRRRVEELRRALGVHREIAVRLVSKGAPCTARVLRPVIWLPVTLFARLTPEQIEAVLAHELAHIRRLDWVWSQLQCFVETVMFYHPAVWWLSGRIRIERENACDDLAAEAVGDALIVAEALNVLERLRAPIPAPALAARGGKTLGRVARLLRSAPRPDLPWRAPLGVMIAASAAAVLALHLTPAIATSAAPPPAASPGLEIAGSKSYTLATRPTKTLSRSGRARLETPSLPVLAAPSQPPIPAFAAPAPPPIPALAAPAPPPVPALRAPPPPALPPPPPAPDSAA